MSYNSAPAPAREFCTGAEVATIAEGQHCKRRSLGQIHRHRDWQHMDGAGSSNLFHFALTEDRTEAAAISIYRCDGIGDL